MKPRPIVMDKDDNGHPVVRVPVASTEYRALVDTADWERLTALGYSGNLWCLKSGDVVYPMIYGPTTKDQTKRKASTLARAVLGALTMEDKVYHKNGDRLDCRRNNLGIKTVRRAA